MSFKYYLFPSVGSVGNLIVDCEVSYVNETSAVVDMTNAILDLLSGRTTFEVFNETMKATSITIAEVTGKLWQFFDFYLPNLRGSGI